MSYFKLCAIEHIKHITCKHINIHNTHVLRRKEKLILPNAILSLSVSVSVSLFISLFLCCVRQANWPASFGNKAWKTDTSLRSIRNQAGSKKPRSDSAASASHLALGVLKLQMRTPEPPTPVSGFLLGFWVKFRLPGFCS